MKDPSGGPCSTCPYLRSTPVGTWAWEEYENLLAQDRDALRGRLFGCHETGKLRKQHLCAGWLFDQDRRGLPSIQLRLRLTVDETALAQLKAMRAIESELKVKTYRSISAMMRANRGRPRPKMTSMPDQFPEPQLEEEVYDESEQHPRDCECYECELERARASDPWDL